MLLVQPDTDRAAHYLRTDAFFLEESGQAVPYFIEECTLDSKGLMRVRFEEIEDADAAHRLVGKGFPAAPPTSRSGRKTILFPRSDRMESHR